MVSFLLTIAIPTWNRADVLRQTLDGLTAQGAGFDGLEILVSDNASQDTTREVCEEFVTRYPGLVRYNRNVRNIGFSGNLRKLFEIARGEFVLILGDDDALEPDALQCLFGDGTHPGILNTSFDMAADCVYLAETSYHDDMRTQHDPSRWAAVRKRYAGASSFTVFQDVREFYRACGSLTHVCVSGLIFRRAAWRKIEWRVGEASGSIQLEAELNIQARGNPIVEVFRPLVKYRSEPADMAYISERADRGFPFVYPFDVLQTLVAYKKDYPPDIYRSFYFVSMRDLSQTLLDAKAHGLQFDGSYFLTRLRTHCDPELYGFWRTCLRAAVCLPNWLFVVPWWMYAAFRSLYYRLKGH